MNITNDNNAGKWLSKMNTIPVNSFLNKVVFHTVFFLLV